MYSVKFKSGMHITQHRRTNYADFNERITLLQKYKKVNYIYITPYGNKLVFKKHWNLYSAFDFARS